MGKVILVQRHGKGGVFAAQTKRRRGRPEHRQFDYSERHGYIKGVVRTISHDSGRGAPVARVDFRHPYKYKKVKSLFLAVEGMYSGQFVYAGSKAKLTVGNILPIGKVPEGTYVCNVESRPGDKGKLARASGENCIVIGHTEDGKTRIKLPSGSKKTILNSCRATIGMIAGGGRTEKPLLKAGAAYHKNKTKGRKNWPRVRGVAKNPVEHPFGGGNHQHIGHSSTIGRTATTGRKVGLIAARRTGKLTGKREPRN